MANFEKLAGVEGSTYEQIMAVLGGQARAIEDRGRDFTPQLWEILGRASVLKEGAELL